MIETVNRCDFHDRFRAIRPDNFSYDGLDALFDWLEDYEEQCCERPMELDVIAICCDFAEYENAREAAEEYGLETESEQDALDWLNEHTMVIEFDGGVIIQAF